MLRIIRAVFFVAFMALCFSFFHSAQADDGRKCVPLVEHLAQVKAHPNFLDLMMLNEAQFKVALAYAQSLNGLSDKWEHGYLVLRSDMAVIFFLGNGTEICSAYVASPEAAAELMKVIHGQVV